MAEDPPVEEVERLAHYDLMAHLQCPCFAIGGLESSERLANLCGATRGQRVLFVGCGTGESARHWARRHGGDVIGIDASARMIERARERLAGDPVQPAVRFERGDAYALETPDAGFDVVIAELVTGLLDAPRAFAEFHRVLKPGGRLGIHEIAHEDDIPRPVLTDVDRVVERLRRIVGLPFHVPSRSSWIRTLSEAGFENLATECHPVTDYARTMQLDPDRRRALERMRREMGRYARVSARIRNRLDEMAEAERKLFSDPTVARHLRYVLAAGTRVDS